MLEAKNGEDALMVAKEYGGQIDLTIPDVIMPHMGGAKLAEQIGRTARP
jgi:YesN/AraC family two-component response regulator